MNRRILLIDSDPTFRTNLTLAVQKYRIDVIHQPDADEAIAHGASEPPELLVLGVEEPDKLGFKIFQRLKKGPLSKIPIMLVTSSVAPESFAKHKALKTHAEDYLDKRTLAKGELAAKIDTLLGLGEPGEEDLDIPVEVDDINVGDGNVIDEDAPLEHSGAHEYVDQKTVMSSNQRIDDDVDDAFAGLMGGDDAPLFEPPARPPTPIPEVVPTARLAQDDETRDFDDLPPTRSDLEATKGALRGDHGEAAVAQRDVVEAIPAPIEDGGRSDDDDFGDFSNEAPNRVSAMHDVLVSKDMIPIEDLAEQAEAPVGQVDARRSILESQPAIQLDADDLEVLADGDIVVEDDDSGGVPEPVHHPRSADDAAEAAVRQSKPRIESSPAIDLGLEKIVEEANKEQQSGGYPMARAASEERESSGVYDRRALRKISELERQVAQLKTELDRARATADAAAKGGGREQTFLNLREKMMASDNELKTVRADLNARETELAALQARFGSAQEQREKLEGKRVELEQRLAAEAANVAAAAKSQQELQSTVSALEGELGEKADALVKTEKARAQLEHDLANERAMRASGASEAERQLRVEREQLVARHQGELQELRQELQGKQDSALARLRSELEAQHGAGVVAAVEATRAEVRGEAEDAIAQLEAQREADIAALRAEHQAAMVRLQGELVGTATRTKEELEQQLAQLKRENETLVAQAKADLAQAKSETEQRLAQASSETEQRLAQAMADLAQAKSETEQRLAQALSESEQRLAQAKAESEQLLAEARSKNETLLAHTKSEYETLLAQAKAENEKLLAHTSSEHESKLAHTNSEYENRLAQTKSEYESKLAHTKSEYESKLGKSQRELEAQLADAHAQIESANAARDQALAELANAHAGNESANAARDQALAEQANAHATELANQANQHAAALAARERELTLARQDDAIAHTAAIAELKAELDKTIDQHGIKLDGAKRELEELIALHERSKSDIVKDQEAAQARLAQEHADELARLAADKQRAIDDIARTTAEHRAALERAAEQHRNELVSQREAADREIAELRQVLLGAKRQMDDAAAKHAAEREQLEKEHQQTLAEQKAQHERAMALANGEIVKVKAVADSEHNRAMAALKAEFDKERKERESAHANELRDVATERDELKRGLSAARDTIKRSENELATAIQTIADRNAELRGGSSAIAERDQRIAELRKEVDAIEQENANYQEQVLRAYQKIKSDEAMVARAKKAMAIALTVLDDQGTPKSEPT